MSECRIGKHLHDRRDEFLVSTKVGETFTNGTSTYAFDATSTNNSIDRSLKHLAREALDIVMVHSDGQDLSILHETDVLQTLLERRQAGDIRHIGFSGKTIEGHLAAIASGAIDVLMVEFNPQNTEQQPVLDAADAAKIGVLVKKGLGSGHVPANEAIPFCLKQPSVASMVVGTLNRDHLLANVELASDAI